jgi:prespore-specific regulator
METIERWTTRSDAWTAEDDHKLAEIVLRHIREGSTQLNAFVEAASLLGRTPAACGYRWNGVVRRYYETEIKEAKQEKKQRMQMNSQVPRRRVWPQDLEDSSLDGIIRALKQHERTYLSLVEQNRELENKVHEMEQTIQHLNQQIEKYRAASSTSLTAEAEQLSEDSKTLLAIMKRARHLLNLEELQELDREKHPLSDGKEEKLESINE